jgi:hypothetical protein
MGSEERNRGIEEARNREGGVRKITMKKKEKETDNPHYVREKGVENGAATLLKRAIDMKDLSYISEFLISRKRENMLHQLGGGDKEELGVLLLEFMDQPLRKEALDVIKEIVRNIRNVERFMGRLKERAVDYSKLVYLKGKIDYIKFLRSGKDGGQDEPEITIKEE